MQPTSTFKAKQGSALVVTLMVMGLLLLLVVAFSVVVRVELRTVRDRIAQQQAKQNARLAMHLALNKLQMAAGPDQRVTARAEILGNSVSGGNRYWTGVWSSENPSASPIWLVSGENPNPVSTAGGERLVGQKQVGNDSSKYVSAPLVTRDDYAFSWFVEDQGVKADISPLDLGNDISLPGYVDADPAFNRRSAWRLAKARSLTPTVTDIAHLMPSGSQFTHLGRSPAERDAREETHAFLSRLSDFQEMALPWRPPFRTVPISPDIDFVHAFHFDLTSGSKSVMSNTLDGGLKQDLTHLRRLNNPSQSVLDSNYDSPQWEYITPAVWEYVNFDKLNRFSPLDTLPSSSSLNPVLTPEVSTDYMTGKVSFTTAPLATEFSWIAGLGIRSTSSGPTREIYMYFYSTMEMANPFPWALGLDNGFGAWPVNPGDLQLRISDFPNVTIRNMSRSTSYTLDLSDFVVAVHSNSYNDHEPGAMRTNFSPTSSYRGFPGLSSQTGTFVVKIGEVPFTSGTNDNFRVTFGTSDLDVKIEEAGTHARSPSERQHWAFFLSNDSFPAGVPVFAPSNDPSGAPETIQQFRLRNWGGFSIFYPGSSTDRRFVHGGSRMNRGRISDTVNFGLHGKYVDEWPETDSIALNSIRPLDDLIAKNHLRKKTYDIDMNAPETGDGEFFDFRLPWEITRSAIANRDDFFHGAYFGSGRDNRRLRIFDFPSMEPLSVGTLNHLHFDGFPFQPFGNMPDNRPPPTIAASGNGPDESLHNFFDRYFFSSLPENMSEWDGVTPLPNQRVKSFAPGDDMFDSEFASSDSSVGLYTQGGFNINSVSPTAWGALLNAGRITTYQFIEHRGSNRFARTEFSTPNMLMFNQSFGGSNQAESTANPRFDFQGHDQLDGLTERIKLVGAHESFIQGARELTPDQLSQLGSSIAESVRAFCSSNGRPFLTMTEFLNEGVLQNAIDDNPSLNRTASARIPNLAPSYFGPGSILNHLAPVLFARSDTFVIRSSGHVLNPDSGEKRSSAYLEAKVQRVPYESVQGAGRRFEIVNFKWVSEKP